MGGVMTCYVCGLEHPPAVVTETDATGHVTAWSNRPAWEPCIEALARQVAMIVLARQVAMIVDSAVMPS